MSNLLRIALISALFSLGTAAKDIRLRNELIKTPDHAVAAQVKPQADEPVVEGLYLIQFKRPVTDVQREELLRLNVELLQAVPEDAFVARVSGARPGVLRALAYVQWIGPMRAEHKIDSRLGAAKGKGLVSLLIAPNARAADVAFLRKRIPGVISGPRTSSGAILRGTVDASHIKALAESQAVLWIEPAAKPKLFDEMASEIVGGESETPGTYVNELGFDGKGVVVSVADSGLMEGTVENMHPDLAGRVDAFFYYGQLDSAADEHSHGTHVAGIVAGNGTVGESDEFGLLYGLGVAPQAHLIAQRLFDGLGGYEPPATFEQMTRDAVQSGAVIGSNSWGDDTQGRYDLSAMEFDALVRDADAQTPGDQPYILEFSAGNAGPGEQTVGSPAVGKNVIATGASQNNRFDFIIYAEGADAMADFSSRGPCEDGRIKPDIVAPGTWIASLQSSAATDESAWLPISPFYQYQGGTSQAGPHASGAAAVFVQYYRDTHAGKTPSPALVKAALINSAIDMDAEFGTTAIPNNDEGWGRIDLTGLIQSDRNFDLTDQTDALAQDQVYEKRIYVADENMPLRFTMTYTDVPGTPLTVPSLVNDLDLEVIAPDGVTYAGNQFFESESVPQALGRDSLNNVECVYLRAPIAGEYIVKIRAIHILQDARRDTPATDQDFALVISGGLPEAGHSIIAFDRRAYTAPSTIGLKLIDFNLAGRTEAFVTLSSATETAPLSVRLEPFGNIGVFTGAVATAMGPALNDTKLQIAHGDTITATYQDTQPSELVRSFSRADLVPPIITQVAATNRFSREVISWTTDESANAIVRYGTGGSLDKSVTNFVFRTEHAVTLTNLVANQTYQFIVISTDEAGNTTTLNNNGQPFTFVAKPAATVLLVDAYVLGSNGDTSDIPVTNYTDALDATGVSYEVWDVETDGEPKLADLLPFRAVIWRINDSFYVGTSLSAAQQKMIENYLKQDGAFMIASMELLTRMGPTTFRRDVLGVADFISPDPAELFPDCPECDQDHGMTWLQGLPGDSIGAGIEAGMNYDEYPFFELEPIFENLGPDFSDTFTADANALPIFVDMDSGRTTGVRLPRELNTAGRSVFLAFPLDAIPMDGPAPNNRVSVLRNILAYLVPGVNGMAWFGYDRSAYTIPDRVTLHMADSDLAGTGSASIKLSSDTDATGISLTLIETPRAGIFEGIASLIKATSVPASGELRVTDGDTLKARYVNVSENQTLELQAEVDAEGPTITGVSAEVDYEYAIVRWTTDEFADSTVQFGESQFLARTAYRFSEVLDHEVILDNLQPDRTYYYQVISRDPAGNTVIDNNGGQLYTLKTKKPQTVPWSDNMEATTTDWTVEDGEGSELHWELGTPANGVETAGHSGQKAWGSNLRAEFATYIDTALISPAFLLTGGNRATLKFWHAYDFTADATIESATLQIVTNSQAAAIVLGEYVDFGASGGWEEVEVDLTPYIGKVVQLVWYHVVFDVEDIGEPHRGWMIDDVSLSMNTENRGTLIVQANLSQAAFEIQGPSPATGQGLGLTNNAALSGTYTVSFEPVDYYNTPPPQTKTLNPGATLLIEGKYEFADVNNNQLSDQWEVTYFGSVTPHSGNVDSDGDGATDSYEFAAGTSPTDPNSVLEFEAPIFLPDRRVQLAWPAATGRSYRVLGSTDANIWTPYTSWVRTNGSRMVQTLPALPPASSYFFQVEVRP